MAEWIIYLPRCHTGEIREASQEALDYDTRVIDTLTNSVKDQAIPFQPNPFFIEERNRFLLHRDRIPRPLRRGWINAIASLARVLDSAGIMTRPDIVDLRLGEFLDPVSQPDSTYEALNFLAGSRKRVEYLMSPKGQQRLDTFRFGAYAYVETRVLQRAINERVFLIQRGTYFKFNLS